MVNFHIIVVSFIMINYFIEQSPGRLITRLGVLKWPPRSAYLAIWHFSFGDKSELKFGNTEQLSATMVTK